MIDSQASHEWKASSGNILTGCYGDALCGESLATGGVRTFCLPLVCLPLSNTTPHRLIPAFSLSPIQFKIQLESAIEAFHVANAGSYTITEVEIVCLMTELSPSAQSEVDRMTGGEYNILAVSYMNSQAVMSAAETNVTANLGFSVSSLERIIVLHRPTASLTTQNTYSNNRISNGLSEFSFLINSEIYPQRPINVDLQGSESWAELLISDHSLMDFTRGCGVNVGLVNCLALFPVGQSDLSGIAPNIAKPLSYILTPAAATGASAGAFGTADNLAATASNVGTFLASCEFESGISDGKSSQIYSGISTLGSQVSYRGTYSNAVSTTAQIDFFAVFTVLLRLNMRGTGVWEIKV